MHSILLNHGSTKETSLYELGHYFAQEQMQFTIRIEKFPDNFPQHKGWGGGGGVNSEVLDEMP